jgi:hypothetical protein
MAIVSSKGPSSRRAEKRTRDKNRRDFLKWKKTVKTQNKIIKKQELAMDKQLDQVFIAAAAARTLLHSECETLDRWIGTNEVLRTRVIIDLTLD